MLNKMTDLLFFLYLQMEFQEGVTFEEWFYNGILTNSNFILIIKLAHCSLSVFLLRQFVHSLTYFDRSQEPKT